MNIELQTELAESLRLAVDLLKEKPTTGEYEQGLRQRLSNALAEYDAQQAATLPRAGPSGPWNVGPEPLLDSDGDYCVPIHDASGACVAVAYPIGEDFDAPKAGQVQTDNARRIVACVNACAGLTAGELERMDAGMLNTLVRDAL